MHELDWVKEFPAAVTICDEQGIILEMNDKAAKTYENDGGRKLIGSNVLIVTLMPPARRPNVSWPGVKRMCTRSRRMASKN